MFIDLTQEGERFQYFESRINPATGDVDYDDPKGDGYVTLRPMGPFIEKRTAARKQKVEHVLNPKTRSMERIVFIPEQTFEELRKESADLWDYCITDFEGFVDSKTQKVIKCTKENKIAMMKNPGFDRFISRCFQIMSEAAVKTKAVDEKN